MTQKTVKQEAERSYKRMDGSALRGRRFFMTERTNYKPFVWNTEN